MSLEQRVKVAQSLAPASRAAVINGTGVEAGTQLPKPMVLINNGAIGGTAPSFTFQVQDSTDNSVFTVVAAEFLTTAQPAAFTAGGGSYETTYKGNKPFLRVAITAVAGTAPTLLNASYIITANQRENPS